ncbi:uncharacterized protein DS421_5g138360 [Arachis hypogaea]|nr:uncharacterized protein DS421_5g138360 [Arachis hypogaea]
MSMKNMHMFGKVQIDAQSLLSHGGTRILLYLYTYLMKLAFAIQYAFHQLYAPFLMGPFCLNFVPQHNRQTIPTVSASSLPPFLLYTTNLQLTNSILINFWPNHNLFICV